MSRHFNVFTINNSRWADTTLDRSRFVAASAIHKRYDINEKTLRRWAKDGKLRHVRYNGVGGKRLYELAHLKELLGDHYEEEEACCHKLHRYHHTQ